MYQALSCWDWNWNLLICCFGPWPTKTGSKPKFWTTRPWKKSIAKVHFVRVPMIAPFVIFWWCAVQTHMHQSNQVKQVAYHQPNPMKHTPKHKQNKRGAKKWILKLSPLKFRRFGGENGQFGYNRASNA